MHTRQSDFVCVYALSTYSYFILCCILEELLIASVINSWV